MRQQNARPLIGTMAACAGLLALAATSQAAAETNVPGEWAQTKSPIHRVGDYNAELSRLCRKGVFRQRKILRTSIGYLGDKGYGITGIAQLGFNLYDPTGAAIPDRTYHFFNQGYSNCRVYVAVTPPPRTQQP